MYRILKPISGGLSVVIREFQNFVKKTGLEAVREMRGDNIPQQFVENVLQVRFNFFSRLNFFIYFHNFCWFAQRIKDIWEARCNSNF